MYMYIYIYPCKIHGKIQVTNINVVTKDLSDNIREIITNHFHDKFINKGTLSRS